MNDTLQILEKVNTFYSASFTQLITVTGGALAVIGVLLPLFIAWQQARQLKRDHDALVATLESQVKEAADKLSHQASATIDSKLAQLDQKVAGIKKELEDRLERVQAEGSARTLHLQALSNAAKSWHAMAFHDALSACCQYAKCQDERNLTACLTIAMSNSKEMDGEEVENDPLTTSIDEIMTRFESAMAPLNKHGRYSRDLADIRREVAAAKKRKPVALLSADESSKARSA